MIVQRSDEHEVGGSLPEGAFATIMSLIPPFTPMLMLIRQSTPAGVPAWQPWIGLIGVALFTTL